ncbi:RING/U-box superfamily protein [Euphorbia peplus]|nr:RING/U-box superfamily protein [Euphorbia peplus]
MDGQRHQVRMVELVQGYVGHGGDNSQLLESSKSGRAEIARTPTASGSDTFLHPLGSGGFIMEESDGRPSSSLDGRRQSCKRKAVEGHIGQSSMSESPGFFQCSENSAWSGVPARYDVGSSLSISAPLEQVNPRLGLGLRGLASDSIPDSALAGRPEASHRNFRLRINPSNQDSIPPPLFSTGSTVRRSNVASSHHSSRLLPTEHSLDFRSSPVVDGATSQSRPVPVPVMPPNMQSFRWNESSSSRNSNTSGSINLGNREDGNSRGVTRNLWEHPMFIPTTELRSSVRNPTGRSVAGGHASVPGSIASASRSGSSSGVHPLSAPTWVSHPNPPSRNSRRLAEYVRRSLISSANGESGGQNSIHPLHSGTPGLSEEAMVSAGVPNQGPHHRAHPRSASWMDRQGDGVHGYPYPLRTLAAGEGRGRLLVSEQIRNVLELVRRGEGLRFEDVMILDQSVFLGVPDTHDRHRDMRLDVDNMSYEELLALEERIGDVSTGLSEENISKQLKQRKYSSAQVETEPCCVCQEEYKNGEDLGTLDCGHDYHTDCIKQWLKLKNWCPICKTTGLAS